MMDGKSSAQKRDQCRPPEMAVILITIITIINTVVVVAVATATTCSTVQ